MGVAPAGVDKPNSGHHHLLIDAELPPLDKPIPNDENHLHFGAGQTEATVTLPKGRHTLQLLLGDRRMFPTILRSTRRWWLSMWACRRPSLACDTIGAPTITGAPEATRSLVIEGNGRRAAYGERALSGSPAPAR